MLAEVRKSGRDGLVALRDLLAVTLESAEPKEVAALAARLQAVIAALGAMPVAKGDDVDEIAARRLERRAQNSGHAAAGGDGRG